ncbi:MAG: ferrous iron transport protein A [Oscillospiraceae bacterium]|nr:ferrous iron transport protein A [Oscillospiraceae bacterium]
MNKSKTIADMEIGSTAIIIEVSGEHSLKCRLSDMGLIPSTAVTLRKTAPMGDPLELHLRGYNLTLRREDARRITVKTEEL